MINAKPQKQTTHSSKESLTEVPKPRNYVSGLGHFLKSKQVYKATRREAESNRSFELGYN